MTRKEMDIALKKSQKEFEKRLKKIGNKDERKFALSILKGKF